MLAPLLIVGLLLALAGATLWVRHRHPRDDQALVLAVDALLPQTQCAQCGYPGCLPYAEAVVAGAATNLCPPGGAPTHAALDALMGRNRSESPPVPEVDQIAVIDEKECIGCALCLPPCPVDAIVGTNGHMHSVLASECTGCELCVPACPVDCIAMVAAPVLDAAAAGPETRQPATSRACIGCGACVPVCPVALDAHALYRSIQVDGNEAPAVDRCVECGLCDRVCPSEIPLAAIFAEAKAERASDKRERDERDRLRQRFTAHQMRTEHRDAATSAQRERRLRERRSWS